MVYGLDPMTGLDDLRLEEARCQAAYIEAAERLQDLRTERRWLADDPALVAAQQEVDRLLDQWRIALKQLRKATKTEGADDE